jgi:hypothetical protein
MDKQNSRHLYIRLRKNFDRCVQRAKGNFAYNRQIEIEHLRPTDTKSFWKYIGKIGVGNDRLNKIPMEVVQEDGSTTCDRNIVLNKWKNSFCDLLNKPNVTCENSMNNENIHDDNLDCEITCDEIVKVLNNMKNGKAPGVDKLPVELLNIMLLFVFCIKYVICALILELFLHCGLKES